MKKLLLLPLTLALFLPLPAFSAVVTFDTWGGVVFADYTVTVDDSPAGAIKFTASVDAGYTADMLAIGFNVGPTIDYNSGNLGLANVSTGMGSAAFDTLVCDPSQGCNFNGVTSDPFDVIVRFATQGNGVPSAMFEISDLGGSVTAADFTRIGIRAQETGPISCISDGTCESNKAISTVPEPGTLLMLGAGLMVLGVRARSSRPLR